MSSERERVPCPGCGTPMNFHAEKWDHSAPSESGDSPDSDETGALLEIHGCPGCGASLSRPASDATGTMKGNDDAG